jgi:hypothetical protein
VVNVTDRSYIYVGFGSFKFSFSHFMPFLSDSFESEKFVSLLTQIKTSRVNSPFNRFV